MSVSHSWLAPVAVKSRFTRSSSAGGPERLPFVPRLLPKTLHHRLSVQIRHTVLPQRVAGLTAFRRHDSLIPQSFPTWLIGASP